MKRKLLLLLCFVAIVAMALVSCGGGNEDHEHTINHVEATAATCGTAGNIEFWTCTECNKVWTDEALTTESSAVDVVIAATGHTATHVDAKAATCSKAGNVEYWTCSACNKVWTDEALTAESTLEGVTVAATGVHEYAYPCDAHCMLCYELTNENAAHSIQHVEAKAPTCNEGGNIEYWYCSDCGNAWTDEALTQVTNQMSVKVPVAHSDLVHFDAIAPACHYAGNIEYWICYDCEGVWQNEALTELTNIKNVIIPATGSNNLKHVEATEANCHQTGNIEYWYCSDCNQFWQDEALTQLTNSKNVITPCTAEIKHVEAKAATCHQTGNVEHWYCAECETVFTDAALTTVSNFKSVTTNYLANIKHVEAAEANCHQNGNVEHWYCEECLAVFTDAALTQLSNFKSVITPCTAEIKHVAATEPTCHQNGNNEYWYCAECNAAFTDAALTQLTNFKNVVIPAAPLTYVAAVEAACHQNGCAEYWYCETCDAVFADAAGVQLTNRKNLTVPYTAEIVHVDAVAANCHQTGNIEYWYCAECNAAFTDAALTQLTNFKSVITPCTAEIVYVPAVKAENCYDAYGCAEYWYCAECDAVFADAALTQLTNRKNLVILPGHTNLVHMDAVAPGCHYEGNNEYWICYDCEGVWADEALTQLTNVKNVIIPATGEGKLVHVEALEATCHQNGNIEYWYCETCEQVWQNEALTQLTNFKNVIVPAAPLNYVAAVEAACHQNGCAEYWYCETCDAVFADAAGVQLTNRKNLTVPYTAEIKHVEATEAGCHQNGNVEYWYCAECNAAFTDAALTQLTNFKNVIVPAASLTHVAAVEAGCHQYGCAEYWYCETCDAVFADAAGVQLTNRKNLTVPYTAEIVHVDAVAPTYTEYGNVEYWYCAECDAVFTDAALTKISNRLSVVLDKLPPVEVTIEQALAAEADTLVTFKGTVEGFYENWSSYNNCSPYITDGTNTILVFRTTTKVSVGDQVTVTGFISVYNEVNQIAQKESIVVIDVPAPEQGEDENAADATISFADAANLTSYTVEQQVWTQNGITVTNDKGASTSDVKNYSNPARFYKNSKLTIEYAGMTKIVVTCGSSSYASALVSSVSGATATADGAVVTIELASAADSFVIEALSGGQVRVSQIDVYTK